MLRSRRFRWGAVSCVSLLLFALNARAQSPPEPPPPIADLNHLNLFYGAVPPNGAHGDVMVFVPGFLEDAFMWWDIEGNDMYAYAYQAGYRTAFLSMNTLNLPDNGSIAADGRVLENLVPVLMKHYGVSRVYMIAHSKGGLNVESLLANRKYTSMAKAVFTLSAPNQGDALADWCYGGGVLVCGGLGLISPAIYDMQIPIVTALRAQWDPYFAKAGVPFYTLSGNTWNGNVITDVTGPILASMTGPNPPPNDGVVTHPESLLPASYAVELGVINGNHFDVAQGHNAFPFIQAQINALPH